VVFLVVFGFKGKNTRLKIKFLELPVNGVVFTMVFKYGLKIAYQAFLRTGNTCGMELFNSDTSLFPINLNWDDFLRF
jgi:hypothetical protein